jgi:oligoribonuclease NrnB/cAMP/cGMP phosphodiesterase (DHH superfamily)
MTPRTQLPLVDLVLYHENCRDGFGSAYAVWRATEQRASVVYQPMGYQPTNFDEIVRQCTGRHVLMLDISFKLNQMEQLRNVAASFLVIDHHKSARDNLASFPEENKIFDMTHSAAVLTWQWCFPNETVPELFLYIEDRDLWNKKLDRSDDFSMAFFTMTFKTYDDLMNTSLNEVKTAGKYYVQYQQHIMNGILDHTQFFADWIDGRMVVYGCVESSVFVSDLGSKMMARFPELDFAVVLHHTLDSTKFSLRSTNERADVSIIASLLGGGGHRNASGVKVKGLYMKLPFLSIDRFSTRDWPVVRQEIIVPWWVSSWVSLWYPTTIQRWVSWLGY